MSNEQYAFLNKVDVPSRDEWQSVIDESGFDFILDPDLKPFEDAGFLPCQCIGEPGGFEISYFPADELGDELLEIKGEKDFCISFRWGGDFLECASALIACHALAKKFDAIVSYAGNPPGTADSLELGANQALEEARKLS